MASKCLFLRINPHGGGKAHTEEEGRGKEKSTASIACHLLGPQAYSRGPTLWRQTINWAK